MKKALSVFMTLLLLLSLSVPAFASNGTVNWRNTRSKYPVIHIGGDGENLYDAEGNELRTLTSFFSANSDNSIENGESDILDSVMNVVAPLVLQGIIYDNWEPYYKAIQKEIGELFENGLLDENGNPAEGSGISETRKSQMNRSMTVSKKAADGTFSFYDYYFYYDWRLDPMLIADQLREYIEAIKAVNGVSEVCLLPRCLGTSIAAAYIQKYGVEDIHGVGFLGGVVYGQEALSETISGKFKIDANAINRYLVDLRSAGGGFDLGSFVEASIDLAAHSGAADFLVGNAREVVYAKLYRGVTSALALSTMYTYPGYWSCVTTEDYEEAKLNVFGGEGSEKRQKYAGLIEKLDNYNEKVRKHLPEIIDSIPANGKKIGVFSKYGFQLLPICQSNDIIADDTVSVKSSSMGATTSNIYDTLSDSYISQRIAEGKGRYISPDKQVDASTCAYPDNTWFIKGSYHFAWKDIEFNLLGNVITAERQLTIDDFDTTQFLVCPDNDDQSITPMTEENCDTYYWKADKSMDKPTTTMDKVVSFLRSLFRWLKELFKLVSTKMSESETAVQ